MKHLWTHTEEATLIQLAELGNTNAQIAEELGRTKSAVAHKRSELNKLMPEEPDGKEEEPDGEGSTEFERELGYVQNLCDGLTDRLAAVSEAVNGNIAAMMEAGAAQAQEIADLRMAVESHEAAVKTLTDISDAADKELAAVREYLSHGAFWRLLHGFSAFRVKALQDGTQK